MSTRAWEPMVDYVNPGTDDSRFITSEQILLACGPPRLSQVGGTIAAGAELTTNQGSIPSFAYPVGAVQSFSVSQSMNLMRFFEIGSIRSYFIPGKRIGQLSLGRVLFHGPSLLRVMYAYYQDLLPPTVIQSLYPSNAVIKNPHTVKLSPGSNNLYINLSSDLFSQPFGMLMYIRDSNEDVYGAQYFEQCYIPNYSTGFDAQGIVVQENAAIQYERITPVGVAALDLITDSSLP
jgi:hypothetical protein